MSEFIVVVFFRDTVQDFWSVQPKTLWLSIVRQAASLPVELPLIQIYARRKTCNEAFGTYIFPNIYHASCTHMCIINDNSSLPLYAYIRVFIQLAIVGGSAWRSAACKLLPSDGLTLFDFAPDVSGEGVAGWPSVWTSRQLSWVATCGSLGRPRLQPLSLVDGRWPVYDILGVSHVAWSLLVLGLITAL